MAQIILSTEGMNAAQSKVLFMALLLFMQSLIGGFLILVAGGEDPTLLECISVLLTAGMIVVTFMLTFLRTGKMPETNENEDEKD